MPRTAQCTISGKDAGGYIWENVFYMRTADSAASDFSTLHDLTDTIDTDIIPALKPAMNESCSILNIAAKFIDPAGSYTVNKPINEPGTQAGTPSVGALCGKITWFPDTAFVTGRQFIAGPTDEDFDVDVPTSAYQTLLAAIVTAFLLFDGTAGTYLWQFGLWTRKTKAFQNFIAGVPMGSPGVLSKRVRT